MPAIILMQPSASLQNCTKIKSQLHNKLSSHHISIPSSLQHIIIYSHHSRFPLDANMCHVPSVEVTYQIGVKMYDVGTKRVVMDKHLSQYLLLLHCQVMSVQWRNGIARFF